MKLNLVGVLVVVCDAYARRYIENWNVAAKSNADTIRAQWTIGYGLEFLASYSVYLSTRARFDQNPENEYILLARSSTRRAAV